jgi:hypothetical protein
MCEDQMSDDWVSETRTYVIHPNHMEGEDYLKVLLCENVLFINNGHWRKDWPLDCITIHVICNDIFAWGCADAEDITHGELEDLYNMWKKDDVYGPAAWCIKKRKQMPQKPVEKSIRKAGIWDLEELIK